MHHSRFQHRFATSVIGRATLLGTLLCAPSPLAAQTIVRPTCAELARLLIGEIEPAPDGVCALALTRPDIALTLAGTGLPPASFRSRVLFLPGAGTGIAVTSLVVPAAELHRVQSQLVTGGARILSVHPHMAGESPALTALHAVLRDDPRNIAALFRQAVGPPAGARPGGPAMMGEIGVVAGVPCVRLALALGAVEGAAARDAGFCRITAATELLAVTVAGVTTDAGTLLPTVVNLRQTGDRTSAVLTASLTVPQPAAANAFAALVSAGFDIVALHTAVFGEQPALAVLHVQATGNPLLLSERLRAALDAAQEAGGSSGSGGPVSPIR